MLKRANGMILSIFILIFGLSVSGSVWAEKQIVMKLAHYQPTTHPRHLSCLRFKELVEKRTYNGIKVQVYPSGQLGTDVAMVDATKLGTLQGVRAGNFEAVAPEILIYTLPFLFDSQKSAQKVTMGPVGDRIGKYAEKNGLLVLSTGDAGGFVNISNNKHPIITPGDMKGLKMRTPPIATKIETMKAFGANPVAIPYGDVYMALKTGVADGQENPLINMEVMKFYEVQKYLTLINYQFTPDPLVVNLKWYRSLSPKYQKILKECAVESMKYNDQLMAGETRKALDIMKKSMEIVTLTETQRKAFIAKAESVYDYFIRKGTVKKQDLEAIRAAIKY
jgi:tripartite ATP-independent transporter DctP family solute receptor